MYCDVTVLPSSKKKGRREEHQQKPFPPWRWHSVRTEFGPSEPSEPSGCKITAYFPLRCVSQCNTTLQRFSPFNFCLSADAGDIFRPDLELPCAGRPVLIHTMFLRSSICLSCVLPFCTLSWKSPQRDFQKLQHHSRTRRLGDRKNVLRMPIGSGPRADARGRKAGSHHTKPPAGASSVGSGDD